MFKNSEEDEIRRQKMKKKEYGEILRNQMNSSQHNRQRNEDNSNAPILEKLGKNYEQNRPKIDKNEYRHFLEKQMEEKKLQQQREKEKLQQEEIREQENLERGYHPALEDNRITSSQSQRTNQIQETENQRFVRHPTITSQKEESQESISRKLKYQEELKKQIDEKERLRKLSS